MPEFNVCLPEPEGYGFSMCLSELCELLAYSLKDLGFHTVGGVNKIEPAARNIIVGCHLLEPRVMPLIPPDSIVVNTEQLGGFARPDWEENVLESVRNFETWDYSPQNITAFAELGFTGVKLLQLGHQPQLARIRKSAEQDIDVLFYGSPSPRRDALLDHIRGRGLNVVNLCGVFGKKRDEYISRSKLVLNLHNYISQIFEIVRVHYLLSNSVAVVSEFNAATSVPEVYREAVSGVPCEDIADECVRLVRDDEARKELADRGFRIISRYPQTTFTKEMLV